MESLHEVFGEAYDILSEADCGVLLSFTNEFPDLLRSAVVGGWSRAATNCFLSVSSVARVALSSALILMRESCERRSWSKEWSSTIKYNSTLGILTHQIDVRSCRIHGMMM